VQVIWDYMLREENKRGGLFLDPACLHSCHFFVTFLALCFKSFYPLAISNKSNEK
jgi:hypothetical protein